MSGREMSTVSIGLGFPRAWWTGAIYRHEKSRCPHMRLRLRSCGGDASAEFTVCEHQRLEMLKFSCTRSPRRAGFSSDDLADDVAARIVDGGPPEGLVELHAEGGEQRSERRLQRARASVLALEREPGPVGRGCAQESLGAAFRHPARARAHEVGVGGALAADQLRPSPHGGGHAAPALPFL